MIEFTRSNVKAMTEEMNDVLNRYGFKNVNFRTSGVSFTPSEATIKITAAIDGVKTRKETDLARYAKMDDIDVNKKGPKGQKLVEYHSRKRKYPYIYETVSGARYKCTPAQAHNMFRRDVGSLVD